MSSRFRTTEISDPRFERDNLRFITVKTPHLKGRGDICVFVPPDVQERKGIPVILLLHGVYGSAWSWAFKTGIHLKAMEMIRRGEIPPMIIAMPSDGLWGDGSGYLPHNSYHFEKWIAEDVFEVLLENIPVAGRDSPVFIAGLSMGGFAALRIGAKYGSRIKGISAHSSITNLDQMALFVEEDLDNYRQEEQIEQDVFSTLQHYRKHLPPIRFDCGTSDQLLAYNRNLHLKMQSQNIPHEYEEFEGGHQWSYWEKHIRKSLLFFTRYINRVKTQ